MLAVGKAEELLEEKQLGILAKGSQITAFAQTKQARFLLISAQPLNEPIARGGPFVMNTQEEISQAFIDFRNNKF